MAASLEAPAAANRRGDVLYLADARRQRLQSVLHSRKGWAAALLAASLLMGVFVGSGNETLPAVQVAADAIGLGGYVEQLALAPSDDPSGLPDEDVL